MFFRVTLRKAYGELPQAVIAHAAGAIDGNRLTNSLEALEHAIACGVRFIELDLRMTRFNPPAILFRRETFDKHARFQTRQEAVDCRHVGQFIGDKIQAGIGGEDRIYQLVNVVDGNGSRRMVYLRFLPTTFAVYRAGTTTRAGADSVFAADRRVRFYYVDELE